jgi:hypothetical protein
VARTWLSIRVDLIEGHGEQYWPRPGRIFAAARSHTFKQLADAIARWDRSHLQEFTLARRQALVRSGPGLGDRGRGHRGLPASEAVAAAPGRAAACRGPPPPGISRLRGAGWSCSAARPPPRTRSCWCCGTRSRCCAAPIRGNRQRPITETAVEPPELYGVPPLHRHATHLFVPVMAAHSHAARSSNVVVNRDPGRAHGTAATTTPCRGHATRGASASRYTRIVPASIARHRRRPSPLSKRGARRPHREQRHQWP